MQHDILGDLLLADNDDSYSQTESINFSLRLYGTQFCLYLQTKYKLMTNYQGADHYETNALWSNFFLMIKIIQIWGLHIISYTYFNNKQIQNTLII